MNGAYISHALGSALRLTRLDKKVAPAFDNSFEGFYRSFFALVICAPIYVLILLAERRIASDAAKEIPAFAFVGLPPQNFVFYAVETLAYIVTWMALPLVMVGIVRLLGASARYVPFVVAYNWGTCVVMAVTMVPYLLYLVDLISLSVLIALYYPVATFTLIYQWRIARDALHVSAITALGVVLLDLLLSVLIALTAAQLCTALT